MDAVAAPPEEIVGREPELATARSFLAAERPVRALVVEAAPGMGKTTLWEAALASARASGVRPLRARPSGAEATLSFAGLIDLLDDVEDGELSTLPAPQLHALRIALLRRSGGRGAADPQTIAVGLLGALRALAARDPLLLAVDDLQWLDGPSAEALAFAVRRLRDEPVAVLLTRRPGSPSPVERALDRCDPARLALGPLSLGATRRLLAARLGLSLSRPLLRRIHDASQGNPLFALELGRSLAEHGTPAPGEEMHVPQAIEEALGARITQLAAPVRRLLVAVALAGALRRTQLPDVAPTSTLDAALDDGVLVLDGDRIRSAHPLLAAVAAQQATARERRALHLVLAGAIDDPGLRTLHLALATERPDDRLAEQLAQAAADAAARGAAADAVMLGEHALRLTPPASDARPERLLQLGWLLEVAGETRRIAELIEPELERLPPGSAYGRGCLLLSTTAAGDADFREHLRRALAAADADPGLRAAALSELAINDAVTRVERLAASEAAAAEAVAAATGTEPARQRHALYALVWTRALRGRRADDLWRRFQEVSPEAYYLLGSPERVLGQQCVWRGELDRAREIFERLRRLADERGEPASYALVRLHRCELELRAGSFDAAARLLDEWAESAEAELLALPMYERCRALLAAGRGAVDEARRWAEATLEAAAAPGDSWDALEAQRALGTAELLAHEPARALASLAAAWEHTVREGVGDPGAFPVAPDLVEALVAEGRPDEATEVSVRVQRLAEEQRHPWGLAAAQRAAATIALAGARYEDDAAVALFGAAAAFGRLGLGFDEARTLLALGRAQRRYRKWGAARAALERAAAAFDGLGAPGWAADARSELDRVGARKARPAGGLTPAEQHVAELAAEGLANKEIARRLVVTVNTVEVHLSHAYAKLGVRSRTQLAGALARKDSGNP